MKNKNKHAYECGVKAKKEGQKRHSPFMSVKLSVFWYAGYDMNDYDEFCRKYKKDLKTECGSKKYSRIGTDNV